ncbi:MAG: tRNA (adenosine(37)-N6)-threonylcarbamoyltransferase complex transferase subunit TsaD, partial [Ruminococcus sp.]|nr:tRNA (adenosine(37)-N6)-threonylcarbamoyltransferase complex transferase subunit TsaD [Ruminococcus sp.]
LMLLAEHGYAQVIPARGSFVSQISVSEADILYEAMNAIETQIVLLACEKRTEPDVARLEQLNRSCEAAVAANYISHPDLKPPYLCLVVSGGHSHIVEVLDYCKYRVVGRTRDDAAGECFDKVARTLGYEYPGGKFIDAAAKNGNAKAFDLPHPKVQGSEYDFSFSGLKTAVINLVHNAQQKGIEIDREDMAASFQRTIADILCTKAMLAAENLGYDTIAVAGGVSANSGVREKITAECEKRGYKLYLPELKYCGDNGAMIACQGHYDYLAGRRADMSLNAVATLSLENL